MKRVFTAGGFVYKKINDTLVWLLIQPRPSTQFPSVRCQLPKGHVEAGESTEIAALREVFEETGIKAKIISKVGTTKFPLTVDGERIFKIITYFLMEYVSGQPTINNEVEEIFWVPFEEAHKKLTFSDDKKLLQQASELVK